MGEFKYERFPGNENYSLFPNVISHYKPGIVTLLLTNNEY